MAQEAINTAVQLTVVLVVALLAWLVALAIWAIRKRERVSFWRWLGLYPPPMRGWVWALGAALVFVPLSLALFLIPSMHDTAAGGNTIAGMLRAQGPSAEVIGQILLLALVKTSLTEEILFRGLIAKRLINGLGFFWGNTIHAVIFGAVHLLIFVVPGGPAFDPVIAVAVFLIPGLGGWVMAWLNEKKGDGSIGPGWLLHGLGNAISYPVLAFW